MTTGLWNHQHKAVATMTRRDDFGMYTMPDYGLFFEQGTGKTRTMIETLRYRFAHAGRVKRTLILCPVIVCENWRDEFLRYSKIKPEDLLVLKGLGRLRVRKFIEGVGEALTGNKIVITNFEAVEMADLYNLIEKWKPEIVICDESQRLKNPQSVRARAVCALSDKSESNFILTGTPILNSAMDLYMQFRILDRGETFGRNFFAFRNEFFWDENAGFKGKQSYFPKWSARPEAYVRMQGLISKKSVRVLAKDCLDLPPLIRQIEEVGMGTDQAKAYKEMLNEYVTFVESQTGPSAVVAQLAITKALRLQQIVSGFAKDERGEVHRFKTCPRLDRLEELVGDLHRDNKLIIWAGFHENYAMLREVCDRLGVQSRELHGAISHAGREDALRDFRTDPEVRVLIANQGAGGVGINLVEAKYAIYYSKDFSLEKDLQSRKRNHRGGSEIHDQVIQIDLMSRGTIDELVLEALEKKENISDRILSWKERLK